MFGNRTLENLGLLQTTTTPTPLPPTATATPTVPLSCVGTPAATEGPYFVDVMLNRSDLREDPTDKSIRPGLPLILEVGVYRVSNKACMPLADAQVDVWQCDALGMYSGVENAVGKKFLRGYQLTDAYGLSKFITVYPGWYRGRTVHIHWKVRLAAKGTTPARELTGQIFFDDLLSDEVYKVAPYNTRGIRTTRNNNDNIFLGLDSALADADDKGEQVLLKLTKNPDEKVGGYIGRVNIGMTW
jgi:protocatechuate 3,4-dioxygenase beta subunit